MSGVTDEPGVSLICCGLLGTIVVDDGLVERSYAEAIATQGVVTGTSAFARRMAQVHQARGQAPGDVLRTLFPDNEARAQAAQLAFDRALSDAIGRALIQPMPGAAAALDELRGLGYRICVLTSLPRRVLDAVVAASGLRDRIDVTLSGSDAPRGFPAPDLVLTAVLRTGADAVDSVAVVHSTGAGVEAGRRSGASIVAGVLTGPHGAARLRAAGATHILDGIAGLPSLIPGVRAVEVASSPGPADRGPADRGPADRGPAPGNGHDKWPQPSPATLNPASISVPAQVPLERRTLGL